MSRLHMSPEEILRWRLDHYDEEVKRLRSRLDEAQEIVVDLLATGERLAKIVDGQKASGLLMGDKDTGWRHPSFATARVWIAQKNK